MEPSTNVANGHDTNGRFVAGNTFGHGNPHAMQVAKLRSALLDVVTEGDVKAIIQTLIDKAKSGDLAAAKLLLDRCLGKPTVDQPLPSPRQRPLTPEDRRRRLTAIAQRIRAERNGIVVGLPGDDGTGSPENLAVVKRLLLERINCLRKADETDLADSTESAE